MIIRVLHALENNDKFPPFLIVLCTSTPVFTPSRGSSMAFSFNDMGRRAAAGEDLPIYAMDVSFDGASPSPFRGTQHDDDDDDHHHDVVMSSMPVEYEEAGSGAIGYVGWPARRLLLACHRIFLNGVHDDPVAVSLEHRGVIFWSLCNMDTDMDR